MSKFTIYGRPGCGFCIRAKQLCQIKGFDHHYIDMAEENVSREELEALTGKPVFTVPQIFHGDLHIGGYDDLNEYLKTMSA